MESSFFLLLSQCLSLPTSQKAISLFSCQIFHDVLRLDANFSKTLVLGLGTKVDGLSEIYHLKQLPLAAGNGTNESRAPKQVGCVP